MEEEKEGKGIEMKFDGLDFRKILEARARAEGAAPTPKHVDLMLENYYAIVGTGGVLNEAAISSSVKLYLTSPIMERQKIGEYSPSSERI